MTQSHCYVEEDLRRPRWLAWFPVHLNVSLDHGCVSHYAPDEKPIFPRSPEGARHGNSRVSGRGGPVAGASGLQQPARVLRGVLVLLCEIRSRAGSRLAKPPRCPSRSRRRELPPSRSSRPRNGAGPLALTPEAGGGLSGLRKPRRGLSGLTIRRAAEAFCRVHLKWTGCR